MGSRRGPLRVSVEAAAARLLALEGVAPRQRSVAVAGTRIHYLEHGAGAPLVLLHGGIGGGANWYRMLPRLRGRRILAPDLPGFGLTPAVTLQRPLGAQGAQIIREWLAALGIEQCDVVGTSFGGLVLLRLMQMRPTPVSRAVLVDAAGLGRELTALARLAALPLLARVLAAASRRGTRWTLRRLLTAPGALPAAHEAALAEFLYRSARFSGARAYAAALRGFAGWSGQREVLSDDELRALSQPTLVVWGERDRLLPASHAGRAAHIPAARVQILEGVGHSPNWEVPDRLAGIVTEFFAHAPSPFSA